MAVRCYIVTMSKIESGLAMAKIFVKGATYRVEGGALVAVQNGQPFSYRTVLSPRSMAPVRRMA